MADLQQAERSIGRIKGFKQDGQTVLLYGDYANLALLFVSSHILRVKLFFSDIADLHTTPGVILESDSYEACSIKIKDSKEHITVSTTAIQAVISKASAALQVNDHSGQPLYAGSNIRWNRNGTITCDAAKTEQSHFYGFGEKTGFLDKQGESYTMWNSDVLDPQEPDIEALYQSIPFFIHFEYDKPAYGLFLDNAGKTVFDMRSDRKTYFFQAHTGDLDFYVIAGPMIKDIIKRYTSLTGRMPIPPKWAIGYQQSRCSYMNQEEVCNLARTIREKKIPCDVIYLDFHYEDGYRVFTFDKTRFPDPMGMITELRELGFHMVPIVNPGILVHQNNGNLITHEESHNLYGLLMSRAAYIGLKQQLNGQRPFVLTRAGYSGVQRYAAVGTGSNRSCWEHMSMAMPMVMNLGLSGVAFAGADIGGFAHHASGQLLARWTQMGAFFPFCRNHSAVDTVRQEPWEFGDEIEDICREYISLRYQLMPHLYSLFYEAAQTGMPVIRPLILEYPDDRAVYNLSDQFLFGRDLLIAPVYRPDTEYRTVYLPEGIWYDYWTGHRYKGGQHIMVHAPLHKMPIFVKAGAVIPVESLKQHADEQPNDTLLVNIYGGASGKSTYQLYEDDGVSFDYQNGAYNLVQIAFEEKKGQMVLSYEYLNKGFASQYENVLCTVKYPSFIPQRAKGLKQIEMKQLSKESEGWVYNSNNDEVLIKINPQAPKGQIVFKLV